MSNKEILIEANEAISNGDFEGFLALCTEDTKWVFEGDQTLEGKGAVRQWMKSAYKEPPKFQVHRLIEESDSLVALGVIALMNDENESVQHSYCDVWRFRDGKMSELHAFVVEL